MCNSKIEKNKINVKIKKIEHGIANICTQETEVSAYLNGGKCLAFETASIYQSNGCLCFNMFLQWRSYTCNDVEAQNWGEVSGGR